VGQHREISQGRLKTRSYERLTEGMGILRKTLVLATQHVSCGSLPETLEIDDVECRDVVGTTSKCFQPVACDGDLRRQQSALQGTKRVKDVPVFQNRKPSISSLLSPIGAYP
jgi:hypothetical protein